MSFRNATKEGVLRSTLALKILRQLMFTDKKYPTVIAKDLQIHNGVMNDYIRSLEKYNIIKKGKRTQSQEYEVNLKGVSEIWADLLFERLDVPGKDTQKYLREKSNNEMFRKFIFILLKNSVSINLYDILTVDFEKTLNIFMPMIKSNRDQFCMDLAWISNIIDCSNLFQTAANNTADAWLKELKKK